MINKREFCLSIAVAGLASGARAQSYPSKPVVIIVPQAPGGTNDAVGRVLAQKLAERMGQSFVVDNRAGAGGNIGTQLAAAAPRDGYTLLLTISSTQAINPSLYKNTGFDPVKDFAPIAAVGVVPNVLVVNTSFPAKNMREFIEVSRKQNPPFLYGSAGNGSLNHLLGEMLNQKAGLQLGHVPYKGVAPALTDVMGGQIPMAFASLPSCIQHIKSGRVRALGVSSAKRSPFAPDIPAIGETVPGYEADLWVGLFAPAGTPTAIVDRLAAEVAASGTAADVVERYAALGVQKLDGGPEKLAAMVSRDLALWRPIVKASGANVD